VPSTSDRRATAGDHRLIDRVTADVDVDQAHWLCVRRVDARESEIECPEARADELRGPAPGVGDPLAKRRRGGPRFARLDRPMEDTQVTVPGRVWAVPRSRVQFVGVRTHLPARCHAYNHPTGGP